MIIKNYYTNGLEDNRVKNSTFTDTFTNPFFLSLSF